MHFTFLSKGILALCKGYHATLWWSSYCQWTVNTRGIGNLLAVYGTSVEQSLCELINILFSTSDSSDVLMLSKVTHLEIFRERTPCDPSKQIRATPVRGPLP